jgi:ferredoxin, 2Fe-2S
VSSQPQYKVKFYQSQRAEFSVAAGENLMQALIAAGHPVASSCNGKGVCGKCKVQVHNANQGSHGAMTALETITAARVGLAKNERLSCQLVIQSDIEISTGYW